MKNGCQIFSTVMVFTLLSFATSGSATAASLYSITDLGTLGGNWSEVRGINDAGQVIGVSQTTTGDSHNFLWSQSNEIQDLDIEIATPLINILNASSMTDPFYNSSFWVPPGLNPSVFGISVCLNWCSLSISPIAINNSGQILGSWTINGMSRESGMFFMSQEGQLYNLGSFGGSIETYRRRSNSEWTPTPPPNPPQVICFNHPVNGYPGSPGNHEFIQSCVSPSGMREAFYFGGNLGGQSNLFYLNDAGQVFGYARTANQENRAFLWSENEGRYDLGISSNLGQWVNPNNLGTLGSDWRNSTYSPEGLNGIRVGRDWLEPRAVLWENDVMTDLNSLIPANSGWFLLEASSINKLGQIVGNGTINGQRHAFLLTPISQAPSVPEPASTFGLLTLGIFGAGNVLRRQQHKKTAMN